LQLDKYASSCDTIQQAISRYFPRFFPIVKKNQPLKPINIEEMNDVDGSKKFGAGILNKLEISMANGGGCEKYPKENMNEQCKKNGLRI